MSPSSAGGAAATSGRLGRSSNRAASRKAPPLEHRVLLTATLCLLAFGAVMVYSASSPLGVLSGHSGTGTSEFARYVVFAGIGLVGMHVLARRGLSIVSARVTTLLLVVSFAPSSSLCSSRDLAWSTTEPGGGSAPGRSNSSLRSC